MARHAIDADAAKGASYGPSGSKPVITPSGRRIIIISIYPTASASHGRSQASTARQPAPASYGRSEAPVTAEALGAPRVLALGRRPRVVVCTGRLGEARAALALRGRRRAARRVPRGDGLVLFYGSFDSLHRLSHSIFFTSNHAATGTVGTVDQI